MSLISVSPVSDHASVVRTGAAMAPAAPQARWRTLYAGVVTMLLLAGCGSLKTVYEAPQAVAIPSQWSAVGSGSDQPAQLLEALQGAWWQQFDDPVLNRLVDLALQRNSDLVMAAWNLRQAELTLGLTQDRQTPSFGASLASGVRRDLDNGPTTRSASANLNVSYEVDLWGRLSSLTSAAEWRLAATEQDLQSTAVALVATVATQYWQLIYQNEQISNGLLSLEYLREAQQLVQVQYDAGGVSGLELQEARRSLANQEAALAQLRQSQQSSRNALAVLLQLSPSDATWQSILPSTRAALPTADAPELPAGIPAEVLARRPDVHAAQARLRATLADGDATRASYFPTLNLTAGLSGGSSHLTQWLTNPAGALSAAVALPFLRQTEMRLSNAASKATFEAAVNGFERTLLTALQEVEDALGARAQLAQQRRWLQEQLDAADKVQYINEVRYRTGATSLRIWLDAQEGRRNAQLALSANRFNQLSNQLMLYKALGGDPQLPTPQVPSVQELIESAAQRS